MTPQVSIVCADWARSVDKRKAWYLPSDGNNVRPISGEITLGALLEFAQRLPSPVLIGVDAALGVPASLVQSIHLQLPSDAPGFIDWVNWLFKEGAPDQPVSTPSDWSATRPFIAVPPGKGSKLAFAKAGIQLHRTIEQGLNANSPLIVSGIPGTVGSGSRELWRELVACKEKESAHFNVWPFDGALAELLVSRNNTHSITLAEIYPKACYGIALAEKLPAKLMSIAKTKADARAAAIDRLLERISGILEIEEVALCYANEDDFDAMISVVAMQKLISNSALLFTEPETDPIEGGVLGKQGLILS